MLKYYIGHQEDELGWKTLIRTNEKDVVTEYDCRNTIYVAKESVDDIAEYGWRAYDEYDSRRSEDYLFINIEDVLEKIKQFIQEREYGIPTEEELKEFYTQMKEESVSGDMLPKQQVLYFWNGSNHRRIVLESQSPDIDSDYVDYTEELQGWEKIDSKEYNTGKYYLYRAQSGDTYLVNVSWYQGSMDSIMKVPNSIENINDALNMIAV